MDSRANVSILEDGEPTGKKPRKGRTNYENRDKEILLQLVSSLHVGKLTVKEALAKGVTTNEKKHEIWQAVTGHFNIATGHDKNFKDIRDLYGRIKHDAKTKHDQTVLAQKAFRKDCRQTGGGMGLAMPSDLDGDDFADHFQGGMDPPPSTFNSFNAPNSSRRVCDKSLANGNGNQGNKDLQHERNLDVLNLATQEFLTENIEYLTEEQIQGAETITVISSDNITLHQLNNMEGDAVATAATPEEPRDTIPATPTRRENSKQGQLNSSVPSVARTAQVTPVRSRPNKSVPDSRKKPATGKEAAATIFYEETLKQRKKLGRYQLAEAKYKLNLNYMKSQLLEAQLQNNGIPVNLPYKTVDIPSSSDDSSEDDDA